ncbi:dihydrofolate reductase family protein [Klenkia brasiliensis]|uniref:Dihydrofolate reductase n=1 Tax=Klenkia brasiliensis TaxID=333142 RepID=A0A1G7V9R7_9ACTN|nr:dihydrofolate reductase family protein [Klenkia brasiliensis]SDG56079.1 Dihydrofolate reductase [Klenkia brasiliensis]
MRPIVITQNITLDGVVDNEQSWFDVTAETAEGRELAAATAELAAGSDTFLCGRTTFEEMRGFWPHQRDDRTGVTAHLERVQKYVVSTTLTDPGWAGTTVLRGGDRLAGEIRRLQEADGADVVLTGSIALGHDLLRQGLVDELRLFTYPVVLGRGRRLFPEGVDLRLGLLEERRFRGGVVLTRYRVRRT